MKSTLTSIIVATHRSARTLARCLESVHASDLPHDAWELIVVDDFSRDDSVSIASQYADLVMRIPDRPRGLGYARNRGAELARGEAIVFLDADVCVHPETIRELVEMLDAHPESSAVCGTLDLGTSEAGLATRYRVLRDRFYREFPSGEIDRFYGDLAIVRRDAFREADMFDEWQSAHPQTAAADFGQRLRAAGHRILLKPAIRGTRIGHSSLAALIVQEAQDHGIASADDFVRPVPVMNARLRTLQRIDVLTMIGAWICVLLVGTLSVTGHQSARWAIGGVVLALAAINFPFLAFLARTDGVTRLPVHGALHFVCALVTAVSRLGAWLRTHFVGGPRPTPAVEALGEVGARTWPPVPSRRPVTAERTRAAKKSS